MNISYISNLFILSSKKALTFVKSDSTELIEQYWWTEYCMDWQMSSHPTKITSWNIDQFDVWPVSNPCWMVELNVCPSIIFYRVHLRFLDSRWRYVFLRHCLYRGSGNCAFISKINSIFVFIILNFYFSGFNCSCYSFGDDFNDLRDISRSSSSPCSNLHSWNTSLGKGSWIGRSQG